MEAPVYTEVRGAKVSEGELIKALCAYSPRFERNEDIVDASQYLLFYPSSPYLIVVNHFPRTHPSSAANTVITFTSYSQKRSRSVAERFGEVAELELLTEHECRELADVSTSHEEEAFETLVKNRKSRRQPMRIRPSKN